MRREKRLVKDNNRFRNACSGSNVNNSSLNHVNNSKFRTVHNSNVMPKASVSNMKDSSSLNVRKGHNNNRNVRKADHSPSTRDLNGYSKVLLLPEVLKAVVAKAVEEQKVQDQAEAAEVNMIR